MLSKPSLLIRQLYFYYSATYFVFQARTKTSYSQNNIIWNVSFWHLALSRLSKPGLYLRQHKVNKAVRTAGTVFWVESLFTILPDHARTSLLVCVLECWHGWQFSRNTVVSRNWCKRFPTFTNTISQPFMISDQTVTVYCIDPLFIFHF